VLEEGRLRSELEPGGLRLLEHGLAREAVLHRRPHRRLALVEVDVRQQPSRLEGAGQAAERRGGVGEVVQRVHHQHPVAARVGQQRVVGQAEHRSHVAQPRLRHALAQHREDARVDVDREDVAALAHRLRDAPGEVTGAAADLSHRAPGRELQRRHHRVGLLPGVALGVLQLRQVQLEVARVAVLVEILRRVFVPVRVAVAVRRSVAVAVSAHGVALAGVRAAAQAVMLAR
jgi:hypothetical protein